MGTTRLSQHAVLRLPRKSKQTEYVYVDELLIRESRNLLRRWWLPFGAFYGIALFLVFVGWIDAGLENLTRAPYLWPALVVTGMPVLCALAGYLVWQLWINARPLGVTLFHFDGKPKIAFRVALACVAECGWTPWEIDYDHQVVTALAPEEAMDGIPPQAVTIFCSPVSERLTEVRVQSRFIEGTRLRDHERINRRNTRAIQNLYRRFAGEAESATLPSPHPLARLRGRLPEEQELAMTTVGRSRARARLWVLWVLTTVIAAVMLQAQPWYDSAFAWPLTFLAAGGFHVLLGHWWSQQEKYALTHGLATVIANPYPDRETLWESVTELARAQRWHLLEEIDEDLRLYGLVQPPIGYPGIYLLLFTARNDAGVEQLGGVSVVEWGVLTALLPEYYAPVHLLAFMQAVRRMAVGGAG